MPRSSKFTNRLVVRLINMAAGSKLDVYSWGFVHSPYLKNRYTSHQENRTITNKQLNVTPLASRKRRTSQSQSPYKGGNHTDQSRN